MNKALTVTLLFVTMSCSSVMAQVFERRELPAKLDIPWEIQYGNDGQLWISQSGGKIVRVNPQTGSLRLMFTSSDYFNGSPKESSTLCLSFKLFSGHSITFVCNEKHQIPSFTYARFGGNSRKCAGWQLRCTLYSAGFGCFGPYRMVFG
jgi:hypothetical protein